MVKNLVAMQEAWVRCLGQADPLEKRTATHSGTLTWRIPRTGSPEGYSQSGHRESDMTERLMLFSVPGQLCLFGVFLR